MTIAARLNQYLNAHNIHYDLLSHQHTFSSLGTAIAARTPLANIAKAVLLKDHEDRKLMAILPANHKVSLSALNDELNASFHLMKEQEVYELFKDCDHGAVPPVGDAYDVNMIYEERLARLNDLYLEAGDHETLIHLNHENFMRLMASSKFANFSHEVLH
jgi:Ala-tRNA(Pro) deacylase